MMEIEVIRQEKNMLEFTIKGDRHTFASLLKEVLLENADVAFASYMLRHPSDENAQFVLRTKSKDAKKVLVEAASQIDAQIDEFEKAAKKAFK